MDSESGLQQIATIEAYKVVENIRKTLFDKGVVFEEERINRIDPTKVFVEKLLRIEVFNTDMAQIQRFVDVLKLAFNKESIYVEEVENTIDLDSF